MKTRNVLLTGIPRSGTTFACAALDSLEHTVCLSEPAWQFDFHKTASDRADYVSRIVDDFSTVRTSLLEGRGVTDRRAADGGIITNYYDTTSGGTKTLYRETERRVEKLPEDFLLGMKHNAPYICVLPELAASGAFEVIAILRNPVQAVLSWRKLGDLPMRRFPIAHGRLIAAERFWDELRSVTESGEQTLVKQVLIYDLFCKRYHELKDSIRVIRYEEMIQNPDLFSSLFGRKKLREMEVREKAGKNPTDRETAEVTDCFMKHGRHFRNFYELELNPS